MSDEEQDQGSEPLDSHGIDANDKPEGGALNKDNPTDPSATGEEDDGGLGTQTDAAGGGEPIEPEEKTKPESQQHPHGQSGR